MAKAEAPSIVSRAASYVDDRRGRKLASRVRLALILSLLLLLPR